MACNLEGNLYSEGGVVLPLSSLVSAAPHASHGGVPLLQPHAHAHTCTCTCACACASPSVHVHVHVHVARQFLRAAGGVSGRYNAPRSSAASWRMGHPGGAVF